MSNTTNILQNSEMSDEHLLRSASCAIQYLSFSPQNIFQTPDPLFPLLFRDCRQSP